VSRRMALRKLPDRAASLRVYRTYLNPAPYETPLMHRYAASVCMNPAQNHDEEGSAPVEFIQEQTSLS